MAITNAEALALPPEHRIRVPMLDGSGWSGIGRALAVGDRVKLLDHGARSTIESIDRLNWALTVARRRTGLLDPQRVIVDPPRRAGGRCEFKWRNAFQPHILHDVHDPGCPYGDGLDDFSLDRARRFVEDVATDGGRYPQCQGRYSDWTFGRVKRDLLSKGGLQALAAERVLVKPPRLHPLALPSCGESTTFFSLRLGWDCSIYIWSIDREPQPAPRHARCGVSLSGTPNPAATRRPWPGSPSHIRRGETQNCPVHADWHAFPDP